MKKLLRTGLCFLLMAAMCLGICVTGAAADMKAAKTPKYENMVAFGDSVGECWGWHLYNESLHAPYGEEQRHYFPKEVAKEMGINDFSSNNCFAASGLRSSDILALLTSGTSTAENEQIYLKDMIDEWGVVEFSQIQNSDARAKYQGMVSDADLVILEVGINDIVSYSQEMSGLVKLLGDVSALADTDTLNTFLSA